MMVTYGDILYLFISILYLSIFYLYLLYEYKTRPLLAGNLHFAIVGVQRIRLDTQTVSAG